MKSFFLLMCFAVAPLCAPAQGTFQLPLNPGRVNPGTDLKPAANGDFLLSSYFPGTVVFDGGDVNLSRFDLRAGLRWSKDFIFPIANGGSYVAEWPQESALLLTAFVLDTFYNKVLVKLDPQGNVLWSRRYGKPKDVSASGIFNGKTLAIPLADGQVLLAGGASALFSNAGANDLFVGKINAAGDIVWAKNLCFSCLGDVDAALGSIIPIADGSFLLTGTVERNNAQNNEDLLLVKLTPAGDVQWARAFNSAGAILANDERGFEIKTLPNGNFAIVGALENFVDNVSDGLLMEVSSGGDFLRAVALKIANSDHTVALQHLEVLNNNTVVVSGSTSQDTLSTAAVELNLLSRVQLNGVIDWARNFYTEPLVGYGTAPNALLRLPGGGYGYLINYALFFDFLYPILIFTDENGRTGCEEPVTLGARSNLTFTAANLALTAQPLTYSEDFPVSSVDFNGFKFPLPYPDLGPDQQGCAPLNITLNAQNPAVDTYAWSTGETSPTIAVGQSGDYAVTVTSVDYCFAAADTVRIALSTALPSATIALDTAEFCASGQLRLLATATNADSLRWSTGDTSSSITVSQPGLYSLLVKNACGQSEAQVDLVLPICDTLPLICPYQVPNAFTPNNDGANDSFQPVGSCQEIQRYWFRVFNRWGEKVFETDLPQKGWDGNVDGEPASSDVYIWVLQYEDAGKGLVNNKGEVSLLR